MYAIVTAGGIPQPGEPLYEYTQGQSKALLDIAGKPMIQWVLDALNNAATIEGILIIGLDETSKVACTKPVAFMPNQGGMLENIVSGVKKVLEISPSSHHAVVVSSDIPAITSEMVNWVINTSMETDDDLYYNIIKREVMEKRFPGSRRTYTKLKDADVCGGDINVARLMSIKGKEEKFNQIIESRKNPAKQAAILGFDVLLLMLLRQITIEDIVKKVALRLGVKGRAIVCPYAEVGMDVDKPYQLELLRADLASRFHPA